MKAILTRIISLLCVLALILTLAPMESAVKAQELCTFTFSPGTGSGFMDPVQVPKGEFYQLPTCRFIGPSGRSFQVWSHDGEKLAAGSTIRANHDMTFTALWTAPAVSAGKWEVSKSKEANTQVVSFREPTTEITLSLPSAEYRNTADVVFVIDRSKSAAAAQASFAQSALDMLDEASSYDIHLKVGVVKFRGYATDTIASVSGNVHSGLVQYGPNTKNLVADAIDADAPGHGSGIHTGLHMAQQLLEADTLVPDSNKYVILMTDGKSYIWDENWSAPGDSPHYEPTSIYAQHYKHYGIQGGGKPAISQSFGCDKGIYEVGDPERIVAFNHNHTGKTGEELRNAYYEDFQSLYNSTNPELTQKTKYDRIAQYAGKAVDPAPEGIYIEGNLQIHDTENGNELFTYPDYQKYYEFIPANPEDCYLEANPYEAEQVGSTWRFREDLPNEDYYMYHVSNLEKGLYKAAHLWSDLNNRYHCGAVYYDTWGPGQGLGICIGFCRWLDQNSELAGDITDSSQVSSLFDTIREDIQYTIQAGLVEDFIGPAFDLCQLPGVCPFQLTIGNTILTPQPDPDVPGTWLFGDPIGNVIPYAVSYNESAKKIQWEIRVPVENQGRAQLSYEVALDFAMLDNQTQQYPTNSFASIRYVSTDQSTGTEHFEQPHVQLEPMTCSIPVSKQTVKTGTESPSAEVFTFFACLPGKNGKVLDTLILTCPGEGNVNGTLDFAIQPEDWAAASEGILIQEKPGTDQSWTWDSRSYLYMPGSDLLFLQDPKGNIPQSDGCCAFINQYFEEVGGSYSAQLQKTDAVTGELLPGSIFSLYRKEPEGPILLENYKLTDGTISVPDLPAGRYYWQEIQSPEGYILDSSPHYFTLNMNIPQSLVQVTNRRCPVPPVFTSEHEAYIIGRTPTLVCPNARITRAEMATIFFRLLSDETRNSNLTQENLFSDVSPGDWYCTAISTVARLQILEGYPDGSFGPNLPLTRAEFTTMAARFDPNARQVSGVFSDTKEHWAEKSIDIAAGNGWIRGYPDRTFRPDQYITRAEAITMVNRMLQRLPRSYDDLHQNMVTWADNVTPTAWYYIPIQEATNSHNYKRHQNGSEYWTDVRPARDWGIYED